MIECDLSSYFIKCSTVEYLFVVLSVLCFGMLIPGVIEGGRGW